MEENQFLECEPSNTPKRNKPSDDEFSPESAQPQKVLKKMEISQEEWREVLEGIRQINSISQLMAKSEELEPLRQDIADIKNSQIAIKEKIESIEKRVSDLEADFDGLKNDDVEAMISDVEDIKSRTEHFAQINLNNILIIRHFPLEIKSDRTELLSTVKKIFASLQIDITENDYDASAMKVRNMDLAFIQLKFSTQLLKSKVLKKFRQMKKLKENEPSFLTEKYTGLSADHALNGKLITMHNRLTKYNIDLLQAARSHVPKHFDFVFDDADGRILAKSGNTFHNIHTTEDIEILVDKIDKSRSNQRAPPNETNAGSSRGTSQNARGRGGGPAKSTRSKTGR